MIGNLSKKIEVAANLAIILVALVVAVVLVKRYFFTKPVQPQPAVSFLAGQQPPPPQMPAKPAAGATVSLPDVDWTTSKQTLVLALSKGCHFCTESAPFYQKLLRETAARKAVHFIAVFPRETPEEARAYLTELQLPITDIKQASLDSIGIRGLPTLVLVNQQGIVEESWVGRLAEDKQAEVLSKLMCETCD
jgi:hypothetical protein